LIFLAQGPDPISLSTAGELIKIFGTTGALLIVFIYGAYKGWWVMGWVYRDLADRFEEVEKKLNERDEEMRKDEKMYRDALMRQANSVEKAASSMEAVAQTVTSKK